MRTLMHTVLPSVLLSLSSVAQAHVITWAVHVDFDDGAVATGSFTIDSDRKSSQQQQGALVDFDIMVTAGSALTSSFEYTPANVIWENFAGELVQLSTTTRNIDLAAHGDFTVPDQNLTVFLAHTGEYGLTAFHLAVGGNYSSLPIPEPGILAILCAGTVLPIFRAWNRRTSTAKDHGELDADQQCRDRCGR